MRQKRTREKDKLKAKLVAKSVCVYTHTAIFFIYVCVCVCIIYIKEERDFKSTDSRRRGSPFFESSASSFCLQNLGHSVSEAGTLFYCIIPRTGARPEV